MNVPFLDLQAQYRTIAAEIDGAIRSVIDACAFAGGPFVERFETAFARFIGSRHCIGVSDGTEALRLALLAAGIAEGDEVITVPNSFIATAEAISACGARPVFVDVDDRTYTMDPRLLTRAITPRTRAIVPVHLYGQAADMDPIMDIARERGLPVIEDACQAHGATYRGRRVGSIGMAAAFSFYPGKNLGAYGEAGAVTTDDEAVARKIRMLRDHGQSTRYYHEVIGVNGRMDGIQGAVLGAKLPRLDAWNEGRARHAALYDRLLQGCPGIVTPLRAACAGHVYHIYAVLVERRDEVLAALKQDGVGCGIHYPVPIHLQNAYRDLGLAAGSFAVSERCARQELSLPMFAELTDVQIGWTAERLIRAVESLRA